MLTYSCSFSWACRCSSSLFFILTCSRLCSDVCFSCSSLISCWPSPAVFRLAFFFSLWYSFTCEEWVFVAGEVHIYTLYSPPLRLTFKRVYFALAYSKLINIQTQVFVEHIITYIRCSCKYLAHPDKLVFLWTRLNLFNY